MVEEKKTSTLFLYYSNARAAAPDLQDGDVEGSSPKIEDGDELSVGLVKAVRQGGCCRLVDDAHHLQTLL